MKSVHTAHDHVFRLELLLERTGKVCRNTTTVAVQLQRNTWFFVSLLRELKQGYNQASIRTPPTHFDTRSLLKSLFPKSISTLSQRFL